MNKSLLVLRHCTQVFVILAIIASSLLSWYSAQLARGKLNSIINHDGNNLPRRTIIVMDKVLNGSKETPHHTTNSAIQNSPTLKKASLISGNHWSGELYGIKIMDPLAGLHALLTSPSTLIVLSSLLLPVLLTMILGRFFCSWLCPAGFLFEINQKLRKLLLKYRLSSYGLKFWRGHKYVLLVTGTFFSLIFSIPLLCLIYPPAIIGRDIHQFITNTFNQVLIDDLIIIPASVFSVFTLFIILLLVCELFVSERLWCKSLCFGGALYCLIGKFRLLRVKRVAQACNDCTDCTKACPMGLNPMKDRFGMECDNCLICINACDKDALKLAISTHDKALI